LFVFFKKDVTKTMYGFISWEIPDPGEGSLGVAGAGV
jgi:hypothetical protein